jgi:hypothetical protein
LWLFWITSIFQFSSSFSHPLCPWDLSW